MSTQVERKHTQFPSTKDDLAVEQVLAAVAAYPTLELAREYLKEHGIQTDEKKLQAWRDRRFPERYQEIRRRLAPQVEAAMADDLLDTARLSTLVERMAIERTGELLKKGKVQDPSRVARDLSQVRTQAIDKRLALEGRPTKIHETRGIDEYIRALEALGVAHRVDATVQEITDGPGEDA